MISIIVPTFNERENIVEFLKEIKKLEIKDFEIIIVDDSKDDTAIIARREIKKLRIRGKVIKRIGKRGKGSAIRDGLKFAKGKYIVLIDADLQYPVEKIPYLIKKLKNFHIVNTRRFRKDSIFRKILSYGFRFFVFFIFGIKEETQSTMRAFKKEVKEKIKFKNDSWAWDVEFLYKAKKFGFKMCSVPIIYRKRFKGKSKKKPFTFTQLIIL